MAAPRVALNHALDPSHVTTDAAWRTTLRPIGAADGRRDVYLTTKQRRKLAAAAAADARTPMQGLSLLPLRPGAVAALTAGKYDRKLHVPSIGKDKAGRNRKIKLPPATAAFLDDLANKRRRKKLPALERQPLIRPTQPHEVGSMDIVFDELANGRRVKTLTVVNDCSKEAVRIAVSAHQQFSG